MKVYGVVLAVLLSSSIAHAQSKEVDLLWKARGLQAIEKIDKLSKKNGTSKGANLSPQEHCEWNLESAFMPFANAELSNIVRERTKSNAEVFKVIFINRDKKDSSGAITQINFSYVDDSKTPTSFSVMLVAEGMSIGSVVEVPNLITVLDDGCAYTIAAKDPLSSIAIANTSKKSK